MYKLPDTGQGGPGRPPDSSGGSGRPSPLSRLEERYVFRDYFLDGGSQVLTGVLGRQEGAGPHAVRDGVLEDS